jgi:hypothetical protein
LKLTYGDVDPPSVDILNPLLEDPMGDNLKQYIVPTEAIAVSSGRKTVNDEIAQHK